MRKYRNRILLGLGLAVVIYVGLLLVIDNEGKLTAEMLSYLRAFPLHLILLIAVAQTFVGIFRFLEWHYYLGVIDARDKISLLDSIVIFVSSFIFAVSPGKVAELLKAVLLKGKTGVPVARSAPIVIAERVVDGIAVIVVLVLAVLLASDNVDLAPYRPLILTSGAILAAGLIVVQIAPLAYFCLNILRRIPLLNRFYQPLLEFYESSREIFKLRHVIPVTLLGMGVYLSSTAGFLIVLYGIGLPLDLTLVFQAMFIVGITAAVAALSFVPNGAGVAEVSTSTLLVALVAPQHPELTLGAAAFAALLQGFFHKWFRVVVGMLTAVIFRKRLFPATLEEDIAEMEAELHKSPTYKTEQSAI